MAIGIGDVFAENGTVAWYLRSVSGQEGEGTTILIVGCWAAGELGFREAKGEHAFWAASADQELEIDTRKATRIDPAIVVGKVSTLAIETTIKLTNSPVLLDSARELKRVSSAVDSYKSVGIFFLGGTEAHRFGRKVGKHVGVFVIESLTFVAGGRTAVSSTINRFANSRRA
jgi:hypothetical protein